LALRIDPLIARKLWFFPQKDERGDHQNEPAKDADDR
jgi:hypothetical protein